MSYLADYELTPLGRVKVQNYVTYVDKRNGYVVMEFDARGKDWSDGSPYPQVFLRYSGADKIINENGIDVFVNLTDLSNTWKRYRVKWFAGSELDNKTWGDVTFTLKIHDEYNTEQTFDMAGISLDLDPAEYHMTILQDVDFGDDSTPGINFTLKDLHNKNQKMTPIVTRTSSGVTSDQVAVTFGSLGTAVFASGYVILNGVKFTETTLQFPAHASYDGNAGKAHWHEATKYLVATPALATGNNSYSIDLVCRNI